jgi:hypothetical protein
MCFFVTGFSFLSPVSNTLENRGKTEAKPGGDVI